MSSYAEWGHPEDELWNEKEAIQLMQEAGAEVAMYEESGARMPGREHYCVRIREAHEARDMASYRQAINGYATAAREACRLKAKQESARRSGA